MGDIKPKSKRNKGVTDNNVEKPKVTPDSSNEIQVHFGNYKKIEIALLNSINQNLHSLLTLLKDVKKDS